MTDRDEAKLAILGISIACCVLLWGPVACDSFSHWHTPATKPQPAIPSDAELLHIEAKLQRLQRDGHIIILERASQYADRGLTRREAIDMARTETQGEITLLLIRRNELRQLTPSPSSH